MKRSDEFESILILHAGALGDCVLTLHLVRAMRAGEDRPAVTLAARSQIARWAHRHGLLDDARSLDEIGAHYLYQSAGRVPERLAEFLRGFDRIISFLGAPGEAANTRLDELCPGKVVAVDPRPNEATARMGRHITRQWVEDLERQGFSISPEPEPGPMIGADRMRESQSRLLGLLGDGPKPIALVHPGSGGLAKCCPIEALAQALARLKEDNWLLGWMVGPDEMERFGQEYVERLGDSAPVIYEESVERAADLVCAADAFIGNDAGMTHLAALAGVRTVALFGPTDPRVWRPLGPSCQVISFPEQDCPIGHWLTRLMAGIQGHDGGG